jgi:deoxyribonuclease IV
MIGFHISKNGDFIKSIDSAFSLCENLGFSPCGQIFARGPQSYRSCLDDSVAREIGRRWPNQILIHGAYVDYLNGEPRGMANITNELATCDLLHGMGVVVHLGKTMRLDTLPASMEGTKSRVFLEINAAKPPNYAEPRILARCFDNLPPRMGLCIDTQHLFACGVSMETAENAADYIAAIREELDVPIVFHLNDSAVPLGSGRDRHEEIGLGEIWRKYSEDAAAAAGVDAAQLFAQCGAAEILRSGLPVILESKEPKKTMRRLAHLYGRQ